MYVNMFSNHVEIIINNVKQNTLDYIQSWEFGLEMTFNCIFSIKKMIRGNHKYNEKIPEKSNF